MTFIIYIVAHVSADPSPLDQFSIYILLFFILLYAIIHELMGIKLIKSNKSNRFYTFYITFKVQCSGCAIDLIKFPLPLCNRFM